MEIDIRKIAEELLREYERAATIVSGKEEGVRELYARITKAAEQLAGETNGQQVSESDREKKAGE
jgi:hypothetical protein